MFSRNQCPQSSVQGLGHRVSLIFGNQWMQIFNLSSDGTARIGYFIVIFVMCSIYGNLDG